MTMGRHMVMAIEPSLIDCYKELPSLLLALALILAAEPSAYSAEAAGKTCMLSDPEKATVAEVLDGETLKLSDGRIVRLSRPRLPRCRLAGAVTIPGLSSKNQSWRSTSSRQVNRSN